MSALSKIVSRLLSQAKRRPGTAVRETLSHGLTVTVKLAGGKWHVGLSRPSAAPSDNEAKVVASYLPPAAAPVSWRHTTGADGAKWLITDWEDKC